MVSKLQCNIVESKAADGSSIAAPITLYDYPEQNLIAAAVPTFTNMMATNLPPSRFANEKRARSGKSSSSETRPPSSTKPTSSTKVDKEAERSKHRSEVKEGFNEGCATVTNILTKKKDNLVTVSAFAKNINKELKVFKFKEGSTEELHHPLTFTDPALTWNLPCTGRDRVPSKLLGRFMVLRGLLGFQNGKNNPLPPNLQPVAEAVQKLTIADNVPKE